MIIGYCNQRVHLTDAERAELPQDGARIIDFLEGRRLRTLVEDMRLESMAAMLLQQAATFRQGLECGLHVPSLWGIGSFMGASMDPAAAAHFTRGWPWR